MNHLRGIESLAGNSGTPEHVASVTPRRGNPAVGRREHCMFGSIGMPEMIIILVIALIIFGPRKLPELGRSLGRSLGEFKKASNELRSTLEEEIRIEDKDDDDQDAAIRAEQDTAIAAAAPPPPVTPAPPVGGTVNRTTGSDPVA